jgi:uncharacterized protein (TIGR02145 family)
VMGIPCPGTPTVKDIDGNTYNTVQIGTQCWTKENLRVSRYQNGDIIPVKSDNSSWSWSSETTGIRCWYDNDSTTYDKSFGNLFKTFLYCSNVYLIL